MKNTVKRTLALLMAASMALAVSACGSSDTANDTASNDTAASGAETSDLGPVLTRIKETGKMVVATASGYMPYEFIDISSTDQKVIGIDMALGDKIAEKLSEKLGVDVEKEVEDTTFTANLAAVAADQVDIMLAGMSPTEERKQNMDFSDVYLQAEQRLMVRAEDADKYKELSDFDGKTIAVQKNTTQETNAKEVLTNSSITSLEKIPLAVLELTTGKADGVVIESTVAQPYLIANPDLVLCDAQLPDDRRYKDTAVAVPKGNEDFLEIINETIQECKDAGLIDQWIEEYSQICAEQNAS
ncbi:transporter substrate-binding domain-containing protein [Agathobaculum sp. Marseille-P7918]|uniref:transporter substrate-binding domain-containing protein n=1 Tax=Agathobaculum sp. Marseille-P7918 TaxID=2479843 RepID=UPI0013DE5D2F|nr:transporter substrate-binding domain-containing protein [Agathobaculum sp. Marseille-P7918]